MPYSSGIDGFTVAPGFSRNQFERSHGSTRYSIGCLRLPWQNNHNQSAPEAVSFHGDAQRYRQFNLVEFYERRVALPVVDQRANSLLWRNHHWISQRGAPVGERLEIIS